MDEKTFWATLSGCTLRGLNSGSELSFEIRLVTLSKSISSGQPSRLMTFIVKITASFFM
jgi:hypothetical protein